MYSCKGAPQATPMEIFKQIIKNLREVFNPDSSYDSDLSFLCHCYPILQLKGQSHQILDYILGSGNLN
jgi:hypothetical protein